MSEENVVVGVFDNRGKAEEAVRSIGQSGFAMKQLSIVGKGYHTDEKVIGFYNVGDRIKLWGVNGAMWGGLWGLFMGGVFMTVPLIGPLVVLGHLGVMLLGAAEGALLVGSVSALAGALASIGIPKDSVVRYEQAVKSDQFLVMAHGAPEEIKRVQALLQSAAPSQLDVHQGTCAARAGQAAQKRHDDGLVVGKT